MGVGAGASVAGDKISDRVTMALDFFLRLPTEAASFFSSASWVSISRKSAQLQPAP
jgi:hypothetical protein